MSEPCDHHPPCSLLGRLRAGAAGAGWGLRGSLDFACQLATLGHISQTLWVTRCCQNWVPVPADPQVEVCSRLARPAVRLVFLRVASGPWPAPLISP